MHLRSNWGEFESFVTSWKEPEPAAQAHAELSGLPASHRPGPAWVLPAAESSMGVGPRHSRAALPQAHRDPGTGRPSPWARSPACPNPGQRRLARQPPRGGPGPTGGLGPGPGHNGWRIKGGCPKARVRPPGSRADSRAPRTGWSPGDLAGPGPCHPRWEELPHLPGPDRKQLPGGLQPAPGRWCLEQPGPAAAAVSPAPQAAQGETHGLGKSKAFSPPKNLFSPGQGSPHRPPSLGAAPWIPQASQELLVPGNDPPGAAG